MARILVLGASPLPFEPSIRQYAANLRTWHFTQPLVADGHELRLVGCRLPKTYPEGLEPVRRSREKGFEYFSVAADLFQNQAYLQEHHDEFEPDAIVGVNTHPASRAVHVETAVPIWCDLNGWVMAEAQAKTYVYDDDAYLSHFLKMECAIVDRADAISTVSEAQAHATIGELALRGRMGRKMFGYPFVHAIPNAVSAVEYEHSKNIVRGVVVPDDAFVVLWLGGYNTWTDVDLLFDALTAAMGEVERLHFVSTGGVIEGHDEISFNRFREKISTSPHRDRFHLMGWVPTADVLSFFFESDLGINVDSDNYETLFGARNRLNEMLKTGLPVLTTLGTEISKTLGERELGLVAKLGDAAGFAKHMIWAARNREELQAMAGKARDFVLEEYSYARTTAPLRDWASSPRRAPDMGVRVQFEDIDFFRQGSREAEPGAGDSERAGHTRVHAIVVHHRGQEMLDRCIQSLLTSVGVELEIVVVSNHCQEELPAAVHTPRVHVVSSEVSLGFSAANNLGVDWSREHLGEADFYYFVNNDTESFPDSLKRLVEELEGQPAAAMAGPKLLIQGAPDHYNSLGLNVTEDGWGWDEAIGQHRDEYGPVPPTREVLAVTGSALLIDAAVFRRVGGWTEVYDYYFEDIDLGIKVWKNGGRVIHVPDAVVLHQISATMTEGSERKIFFFWRNRLMLALVHWPPGLLLKTFKRAVFDEILDRRRTDHPLARRAMAAALGKLPALVRCRFRFRGSSEWRRFLVPPGSVPVITLPETGSTSPRADREPSAPASRPVRKPKKNLREKLALAERRVADLETSVQEARQELDKIHRSKMWRAWMITIAVRRWLARPFAFLKSTS